MIAVRFRRQRYEKTGGKTRRPGIFCLRAALSCRESDAAAAGRKRAGEAGVEEHDVVVDARDAAGADHLAFELRRTAAVEVGRRFGDHGREIGLTGQGRDVHVVEDESEVALHASVAEPGPDIRQIELHFRVGPAVIRIVAVGVVARAVSDDRVARLERIEALFIGRNPDGRTGEYHTHKSQRLAVGVGHTSAYPGHLGMGAGSSEQGGQQPENHSPYLCGQM